VGGACGDFTSPVGTSVETMDTGLLVGQSAQSANKLSRFFPILPLMTMRNQH
jgi:hypothetical protein